MLGYLGNSSNTDMPHLHFQVMDSPQPLASNGLPYVFDAFTLSGTVSAGDLDACMFDSVSCNVVGSGPGSGDATMTKVMPMERDVIAVKE